MKDSTPGSSLFRKQALTRLSSPDRLAQRVSLISPRWWLALLALVAVLCVASFWAWHGRIATKVQGTGMFLETGGLYTVVAATDGVLDDRGAQEPGPGPDDPGEFGHDERSGQAGSGPGQQRGLALDRQGTG